jgi:hypothetical protein
MEGAIKKDEPDPTFLLMKKVFTNGLSISRNSS